jgi:hypothetical protein
MNIIKRFVFMTPALLSMGQLSLAQDKPIGYWESHLPYNSAVGVSTDGVNLFTICNQSFFTLNGSSGQMEPYSKVEGMSDVDMQYTAYDAATGTIVLAYTDGNIDLFKNNTFYNIPDFEIKQITGTKAIYHIYTENGIAYLSTSIGILVIDLTNKDVQETYQFSNNGQVLSINGFYGLGDYFYTITSNGLYRAPKNSPELQNFAVWQQLDSTHQFKSITATGSNLFVATADSLFLFNDSLSYLYSSGANTIRHLDTGSNALWICEENLSQSSGGDVKKMDASYHLTDSFSCSGRPVQIAELMDGSVWVADSLNGLGKRNGNQIALNFPPGPSDPNAYDIYAYNKNVWIAHGGYTDIFNDDFNPHGFSNLNNGKWTTYTMANYPPINNMYDFDAILQDQTNGTVYAGSYSNGLLIMNSNGSTQHVAGDEFDVNTNNTAYYPVVGLALDHEDDLWVAIFGGQHELVARATDGTWYKFSVPVALSYPNSSGPIVIDDNDQEWYVCDFGVGAMVYNTNGTLSDPTDDSWYHLTTGAGYGNLPSNNVYCIAKDNNDDIWIGTDDGIGIVSCAGSMTTSPCDASIPIVQYDQFAGYLFSGENVRTIAVDGGNRKWVGTDNGVWLLSPDASTIIYRFTTANSPLPSNNVQKITIDPVTGDVYIGTQQGVVTYRSTATQGGTTNQNVLVFPDPVPSGYNGTIAIKGLVANADVRITDITGQLVYRTTALGGQAVWSGVDYTGHRPQSGVYLIFVTNSDGTQTYSGKMVFMN